MKLYIRQLLGRGMSPLVYNESSISKNSIPLFTKTFGDSNPDKYFYVIRQPGAGRGLFSLFSSVLCHLDICDSLGFIPVVDFQNFSCVYNDYECEDTKNAWEYYFEPVSQYTLDEVYSSKNVFFSIPSYPNGYSYSITAETKLHSTLDKYIKFKSSILEEVESYKQEFFLNRKVLGIHFRGQEMKTAPNHWYPPTKKQMKSAIDLLLEQYNFNALFIVTEEESYLDFLRSTYKSIDVLANNHYRTYGVNAYKQKPRKSHLFLLGKEIAIDALLLAHCQGLIYCTSNVATVSDFLNGSRYEAKLIINNGPNFSNPILAKYSWYVKAILPKSLGGFSSNFKVNI